VGFGVASADVVPGVNDLGAPGAAVPVAPDPAFVSFPFAELLLTVSPDLLGAQEYKEPQRIARMAADERR